MLGNQIPVQVLLGLVSGHQTPWWIQPPLLCLRCFPEVVTIQGASVELMTPSNRELSLPHHHVRVLSSPNFLLLVVPAEVKCIVGYLAFPSPHQSRQRHPWKMGGAKALPGAKHWSWAAIDDR